jgi:hypothetical protein
VYLLADDTKIFNIVKYKGDKDMLQLDLGILTEWSEKQFLRFNPDKCKHMHIGRKDPNSDYRYELLGNTLEQEEQDIGVIMD